jgi:hypothetical protein
MTENFEETYQDVLQNIEFTLVQVYKQRDALVDTGTMYALDTLIKVYTGERQSREVALPQFKPEELAAYEQVRDVCQMRLGRSPLLDKKGREVKLKMEPITVEEIIACLKRIRKSVEGWYKRGGRRGYYDFVKDFIR